MNKIKTYDHTIFGHARMTTPTCRKYRTFASPLEFPSYATAYSLTMVLKIEAKFALKTRLAREGPIYMHIKEY